MTSTPASDVHGNAESRVGPVTVAHAVSGAVLHTARPRLLDGFCGEGGAGAGYDAAGFDVLGIDVDWKALGRYPFRSMLDDALDYIDQHWREFDAVHTSAPCQSESTLRHRTGVGYVDWLGPTIELLRSLPIPWVIENVESTKQLPGSTVLCGSMFGLQITTQDGTLRTLKRHRRFLGNFPITAPGPCSCRGVPIVGVYGTGGGGQMTRGYKATRDEAQRIMGMPWASRRGVSEAIPPVYAEYVGRQLLAVVTERNAA